MGADQKREAQQKLSQLLASVGTGSYVEPNKITVGTFVSARIEQWESSGVIGASTADRYRSLLAHQIAPHIGTHAIQRLKPLDIEAWHSTLRRSGKVRGQGGELAPRTIRHAHRLLSQALRDAERNGLIVRNVCKVQAAPRVDDGEIVICRDVPALLGQLRGHDLEAIATVALCSGMRLGELLALRWNRVDLDRGVIQVRESLEWTKAHGLRFKTPKTKAGRRDITLPMIAIETLRQHRRQQLELRMRLGAGKLPDDALLFADVDGGPLYPARMSSAWGDFADAIGSPELVFHGLRHTHVSLLIDAGVDIVKIPSGPGTPSRTSPCGFTRTCLPLTTARLHKRSMQRFRNDSVAIRWQFWRWPRVKHLKPLKNSKSANGLVDLYERAGYVRVDPPILQPADAFFELSGEELRHRLFLTENSRGQELCLRPDLTIPVCLAHLENGAALPARYCYLGPVFRDQGGGGGEYLQAGIESLGRADREAADAECVVLALESARHYGAAAPMVRMGDVSLFSALIAALDLPPVWQRRLLKDFNRTGTLQADLSTLKRGPNSASTHAGMLAALQGSDPAAAHALVTDLLSIAGISTVGGRTVAEIAERFLEQASLGATTGLAPETSAVLERYLAIEGDPDEALAALRALAAEAKLEIGPALDAFEQRTGFIAAGGVDVRAIRFATAFGRPLDYYTGMVFELHDTSGRVKWPLAAGGRYDQLLTVLGSAEPIPAVGCAAWIGELEQAGSGA